MISDQDKQQIIQDLKDLGGVNWAKQIEKCQFFPPENKKRILSMPEADVYYTDLLTINKEDGITLNIGNYASCIVGEVKSNNDLDDSDGLFGYMCKECTNHSDILFKYLRHSMYKKKDEWWVELKIFIEHYKLTHLGGKIKK